MPFTECVHNQCTLLSTLKCMRKWSKKGFGGLIKSILTTLTVIHVYCAVLSTPGLFIQDKRPWTASPVPINPKLKYFLPMEKIQIHFTCKIGRTSAGRFNWIRPEGALVNRFSKAGGGCPSPLAVHPDQIVVSFSLNNSRILHRKEHLEPGVHQWPATIFNCSAHVDQLMWVLLTFCFSGKLVMEKGPFGAYPILNTNPN